MVVISRANRYGIGFGFGNDVWIIGRNVFRDHSSDSKCGGDEWTDEILIGVAKKIVAIEKKLGGLSDMIIREMESPFFPAGIVDTYKDNLLIYNMVMKEVSLQGDIHILKSKICEYVKKKKWAPAYELCSELIGKLPNDFFTDAGINMEIGDIKDKFTIQLWAQCLLDI